MGYSVLARCDSVGRRSLRPTHGSKLKIVTSFSPPTCNPFCVLSTGVGLVTRKRVVRGVRETTVSFTTQLRGGDSEMSSRSIVSYKIDEEVWVGRK